MEIPTTTNTYAMPNP